MVGPAMNPLEVATTECGAAACSPPDVLADLNGFKHHFISKDKRIRIWLTLEQELPGNSSWEFISFGWKE